MQSNKEHSTNMHPMPQSEVSLGEKAAYSDTTGRQAKKGQITALDYLCLHRDKHVRVVMGPTGFGKSFIAMALAEKGTVIIVSDNVQLAQYAASYPEINVLKGKAHYDDRSEYEDAKLRLWQGDVTITNIHAWVTFKKYGSRGLYDSLGPSFATRLIIIDEFHKLEGTLIGMESGTFTRRSYPALPLCDNIHILLGFFRSILTVLKYSRDNDSMTEEEEEKCNHEIYKFQAVINGLDGSSSDYVIDVQKSQLVVTRYAPSDEIVNLFKSVPKVLLMSATPRPGDIKYFTSAPIRYNAPSDIPKGQRQIKYVSTPYTLTYKTELALLKPYIDKILVKHAGQNGVIHVPYFRQMDFRIMYPHFLYHSPQDKAQVLHQFKTSGGIMVASGCAEGIDLVDDECRFQIIPWMLKPSLGDLWVQSRRAKKGGQTWYDWEVLTTFAQMAGRSTRGVNDWSTVYTFDVTLYKLYSKYQKEIWKWFSEALVLYSRN